MISVGLPLILFHIQKQLVRFGIASKIVYTLTKCKKAKKVISSDFQQLVFVILQG